MIIYQLKRSKKGNYYWVPVHVPDTPTEEDDEAGDELEALLLDTSGEEAIEMFLLKEEVEKVLLRAGLGEVAVKIAFDLMDGYTRADIARRLKMPYDKVDYLYRKIKRVLKQHFRVAEKAPKRRRKRQ